MYSLIKNLSSIKNLLSIQIMINSSISVVIYHRIVYSNNMYVKQLLIDEKADNDIIENYDNWLKSGFLNQLFTSPISYKN